MMKIHNITARAWQSFRAGTKLLLRALGLNLIVSCLQNLKRLTVGKGGDEEIKIAIRQSRKIALLRALIHLIPFCVAVWEIALNFNTYYVGTTPLNQAYYQFGAKIHEMAAQASLAAIVFTYVRYELSLGQGLPFGALFSGLQVSQGMNPRTSQFPIQTILEVVRSSPRLRARSCIWVALLACCNSKALSTVCDADSGLAQ